MAETDTARPPQYFTRADLQELAIALGVTSDELKVALIAMARHATAFASAMATWAVVHPRIAVGLDTATEIRALCESIVVLSTVEHL
jgi:hypothetical protein